MNEPSDQIFYDVMEQAEFTVTCAGCTERHLAQLAAPDTVPKCVHRGVDARRFSPATRRNRDPEEQLRLLAVGRLCANKGLGTFIEACALLRNRGYDFRADIVGHGEEHDRLQQQIQRLALGGRVNLRGPLNDVQLIDLYQAADVFAAPGEVADGGGRDGVPHVLLEAMAMRLAVVATQVAGIPDVVRHECNGLMVPERDPVALSAAMARLMNDQPLRLRFGANARRTVTERFSEGRNCTAMMDLPVSRLRPARPSPVSEPMYASA